MLIPKFYQANFIMNNLIIAYDQIIIESNKKSNQITLTIYLSVLEIIIESHNNAPAKIPQTAVLNPTQPSQTFLRPDSQP